MSVLWCGGEDIDFPNSLRPSYSTDGSTFRSGYARQSILINGAGGQMSKGVAFPGGAVTDLWFSFYGYTPGSLDTNRGYIGLGKVSGTNNGLFVGLGASTGKLAILKLVSGAWTVLASETGTSINPGTLYRFDLHVQSFGGTATIDLYLNGNASPACTFSGAPGITDVTSLECVLLYIGSLNHYWCGSEFIVADVDTRTYSLVTMYPDSAGSANEWTGAYTDIDDPLINDADVLYTEAAGNAAQFGLTTIPAGDFTIKHMKIAARVAKAVGATVGSVKLGVLTDSTIDLDAGQAADTAWDTIERHMPQNPVTENDWQPDEMAGLQLAVESSAPGS